MTDEYIRKQDALDAFGLSEKTRKYGGDHSGYDTRMLYEIQDTIESIEPAAAVAPVVRCKDCIHNNDCDIQYSAQAGENFFCGFGETEKDVREDVYE